MSDTTLGFLRGLLVVVVAAIVHFLADGTHLDGVVSNSLAVIISSLALAFEHSMQASGSGALFGAVKK